MTSRPALAAALLLALAAPAAAATKADTAAVSEAAQKKVCDAKWKENKASTHAKGWKAYFTFMANCM